ncbi:hypothetical protein EX227_13320 [Providencia rettgeri]|uniref:Lipoprotein n=1 Tax=Providencia rettgeri TaxID=587 RepID=A0AAP2JW85_PRORE|nr:MULTISPECIES: hypothetical protein [Providencia]ELI9034832.1 hypothetical protein [Morganella morganii]MBX6949226.1 hypothetical protein [Providencia rettgeri]MBX6956341.1 hypothetical protein [Providencia rettgeri]MBX6958319.1 hypothetical protein [Providencia rettgeri]MBX6971322.1 hypothetical protein [Providencia rettgeri]
MNKLIILPLTFFLAGCSSSLGLSLDERYQAAYQEVVTDPSADNMTRYMQLSKEVAERDMRKATEAAESATRESDKGFTEYFKQYGSESFKRQKR